MAREIRQRTSKHIKMRLLLLETRAHEFATLCRGALIDHKRRHVDLRSLQLRVKLDRLEHWQTFSRQHDNEGRGRMVAQRISKIRKAQFATMQNPANAGLAHFLGIGGIRAEGFLLHR